MFCVCFSNILIGNLRAKIFLRFRAGVQLPKVGTGLGEIVVKFVILFCFFIGAAGTDICTVVAQICFPDAVGFGAGWS